MVRRWSYINSINCDQLLISQSVPKASVDVNLNTLMYLKKRYTIATKLTRKQWARRKHLHNWIAPLNILKDWAKSYRFHRNIAKLIYFQFFTKNSFVAFNIVAACHSIPALYRGSESVVTGSYSKKILRFFIARSNSRCFFFSSFSYSRPLLISLNPNIPNHQIEAFFDSQTALVPLYYDVLTSLMPWTAINTPATSLRNLFAQLNLSQFKLFLSQLLTLYKSLVLLTLKRFN